MVDPITYVALGAVADFLRAIKIDDGFYTDLGTDVTTEPLQVNGEVSDPLAGRILVIEDDSEINLEVSSARDTVMDVVIEAYIQVTDADAQIQAHRIRSDILKALPTRTKMFPLGVHSFKIIGRKILQRPQGTAYVVVQIRARLGLIEPAAQT